MNKFKFATESNVQMIRWNFVVSCKTTFEKMNFKLPLYHWHWWFKQANHSAIDLLVLFWPFNNFYELRKKDKKIVEFIIEWHGKEQFWQFMLYGILDINSWIAFYETRIDLLVFVYNIMINRVKYFFFEYWRWKGGDKSTSSVRKVFALLNFQTTSFQ